MDKRPVEGPTTTSSRDTQRTLSYRAISVPRASWDPAAQMGETQCPFLSRGAHSPGTGGLSPRGRHPCGEAGSVGRRDGDLVDSRWPWARTGAEELSSSSPSFCT